MGVTRKRNMYFCYRNPIAVSPFEHELVTARPNRRISRGLTLISKLLQATANGPSITRDRDPSIQPFQPLIDKWTEPLKGLVGFYSTRR